MDTTYIWIGKQPEFEPPESQLQTVAMLET